MTTRIRLPTAPIPPPRPEPAMQPGPVPGLAGLIRVRDGAATVARRVSGLQARCEAVLVVDDGSQDATADAATAAGARVLRFPTPRGEGVALRAGLRVLRELGHIGVIVPGDLDLAPADLDHLAQSFLRAPEAMLLGVGPGEAIAGKEWEEAAALARGETPAPLPTFRPPRPAGLAGVLDRAFQRLAETRFAHPWGGPRVLPLQGILRQPWREDGPIVHLEMLSCAIVAGIPTVEVELSHAPPRVEVSCKKPTLRLLARWAPTVVSRRIVELLGWGGGYAPPTTSPLALVLGLTMLSLVTSGGGCVHHVGVAPDRVCPDGLELAAWPGAGDPAAAWMQFRDGRMATPVTWAEQEVVVDDPAMGHQKLRGVTVQQGPERWRMRLLLPLGMTALDYVRRDGLWELTVPAAGLRRAGRDGEPLTAEDQATLARWGGLDPSSMGEILGAPALSVPARWGAGCALLEVTDSQGGVVRRIGFTRWEEGWVVGQEELVRSGVAVLVLRHEDWRPLGNGLWPWKTVIDVPGRKSHVELITTSLRTEGVQDAFFALSAG